MRSHSKRCEQAKTDVCHCQCKGRYHKTRRIIKGKVVHTAINAPETILCAEQGCYETAEPFSNYCKKHEWITLKPKQPITLKAGTTYYITPSLDNFTGEVQSFSVRKQEHDLIEH